MDHARKLATRTSQLAIRVAAQPATPHAAAAAPSPSASAPAGRPRQRPARGLARGLALRHPLLCSASASGWHCHWVSLSARPAPHHPQRSASPAAAACTTQTADGEHPNRRAPCSARIVFEKPAAASARAAPRPGGPLVSRPAKHWTTHCVAAPALGPPCTLQEPPRRHRPAVIERPGERGRRRGGRPAAALLLRCCGGAYSHSCTRLRFSVSAFHAWTAPQDSADFADPHIRHAPAHDRPRARALHTLPRRLAAA